MTVKSKKTTKGKWDILVMRSKGEVAAWSVSPCILALGLVFALLFAAAGVVIINLYFGLYLDFRDLKAAHRETAEKLARLDSQYRYQLSVVSDYAALVNELNWPVPASTPEPAEAAGQEETTAADPLLAWAETLPAVQERPEEKLAVEDFQADGGRFSFQLINETPGGVARGRLLALFLVEAGGQTLTVPFPDFDPSSPNPNFDLGPGYSIRSSKPISGQLRTPDGGEIMAVMVVAKSGDGRIIMKKRLTP